MSNPKNITNYTQVVELLRPKPECWTPDMMYSLFGEKPDADIQDVKLSFERLEYLYSNRISLITFVNRPALELIQKVNNRFRNGELIIPNHPDFDPKCLTAIEKYPTQGPCLISIGCIPKSKEKNYWKQTLVLADYVEEFLPEITSTLFWKEARLELVNLSSNIGSLLEEKEPGIALGRLKELKINQHFRPSASETLQQIIACDYLSGKKLFSGDSTLTSDFLAMGDVSPVSMHMFGDCLGMLSARVNNYHVEIGCSFKCNLGWLAMLQ
ncbi:MAG: hypothetical protein WCG55_02900 [bacterium]